MNEVIKNISERVSYRKKYSSEPVPKEHLKIIMQAGLDAPSGCNRQTTSLIAVDNPEIMKKLHEVITPPVCETAPCMICVLTRKIFAYRDKCFNVQDYSAAIENMLLAAASLGYSSCWIEGHITDDDNIGRKMADILNVPDNYDLVCFLPIGKALEKAEKVHKKAFEERAWFNKFGAEE
ncbi:MAG: nitroreductase family protein [Ruminococcus sp.]|nr:nitroreductase family protein [Ruminococcus sp.]